MQGLWVQSLVLELLHAVRCGQRKKKEVQEKEEGILKSNTEILPEFPTIKMAIPALGPLPKDLLVPTTV